MITLWKVRFFCLNTLLSFGETRFFCFVSMNAVFLRKWFFDVSEHVGDRQVPWWSQQKASFTSFTMEWTLKNMGNLHS